MGFEKRIDSATTAVANTATPNSAADQSRWRVQSFRKVMVRFIGFMRRHVLCVFGLGDLSIADEPTKIVLARRESLRLVDRCTTG